MKEFEEFKKWFKENSKKFGKFVQENSKIPYFLKVDENGNGVICVEYDEFSTYCILMYEGEPLIVRSTIDSDEVVMIVPEEVQKKFIKIKNTMENIL